MRFGEIIAPLIERRVEGDARSFGIWLGRYHEEKTGREAGIHLYDYLDDRQGYPLRYRLMADKAMRTFIHAEMAEINRRGWHLTVDSKRARNRWQMVFEPLLTSRVPRNAIFWHVTPKANLETILRQGLQPRHSRHGLNFPQQRIYLMPQRENAPRMMQTLNQRDPEPVEYAVLRVDLRRAKGVKLHIDPELPEGISVYTTQPIPPNALSLGEAP